MNINYWNVKSDCPQNVFYQFIYLKDSCLVVYVISYLNVQKKKFIKRDPIDY